MKNLYSGLNSSISAFLLLVTVTLTLGGCTALPTKNVAETMKIKASALTKLSAAVEATVQYDTPDINLSDKELLSISTQDEPNMLDPFAGYTLKVNREFNHAIILVCNAEGTKGLLEDAGCSGALDKYLWEKGSLCEFTLSANVICD
ncbi:hypothetical protein [Citrobacter portucalensis]|uniref:hypothetical protein n=1 Tax=Citrobacter portucalensis TaxID=1639133 RepID=UPI001F156093|nr:hypothetical protein [Citrobacter portucalensis]